jgi:gamma-glutamylcyclotransferase (GGCT)/AIG2-like uncharacterized protein YtfP
MRKFVHHALTGGRLFVYGTLMRGEEAHHKLHGCPFLGSIDTTPEYQLVKLGDDFEGLVENGTERVRGELYLVTLDKLAELDDWEYDIYARDYVQLAGGGVADAYILRP